MSKLENNDAIASPRPWQFSLAQLLLAISIFPLLLVCSLKTGFWGVVFGLMFVLGAWLFYVAIRDRRYFNLTQLLLSLAFVSFLMVLDLWAGIWGVTLGLIYAAALLPLYLLIRFRQKVLVAILVAAIGANFISWAFVGIFDETLLMLPYEGAANFNLDFALICGDAARSEQLSKRESRETICPSVKHIYYEGEAGYGFNQIAQFGDWYENNMKIPKSSGLHFNVETFIRAPMIRIVREESLGRGLFGSGSEVLYVWAFNRWVRVYDELRWFS